MGIEERMDCQYNQITLYTSQTDKVVHHLLEQGYHYVKTEYIVRKYAEVSAVFLQAYSWYTENAQRILPKPQQAESAVWSFCDVSYLDRHPGCQILKLRVPIKNAVFFRMSDWNKVLNLRYIGESEEEEAKFAKKLARYGIRYAGDAYTTPFYPHLKKEIQDSWKKLFRYNQQVKENGSSLYPDMQAGLWYLDRQWIQQMTP
ncbi:DUF3841 domain-containing protein [Sporomusa acidovorans]|uniref:DUF3841 domain-containing protein n=1 Tax=Sporomusa acidovorans (strain ATCC 49682 / DSM 3132 / Mol) TaxID=1123286 RepID=A0ABZ3J1F5_SPOA4|nr:DUF3841 domain-containing protein [Sporomusa acidovorans]OZC16555.1 hypothetical protein SPACI_42370 [Sporomusa acidovorans DSM 3132]SDF60857.1 protein of unknown function [Sporomusa acidovorans]